MSTLDTFLRRFVTHQRAAREGGMERRAFLRSCLIGGAALPFLNTVVIDRVLSPCEPYTLTLIRAMGADVFTAQEAQKAFAAIVAPSILRVIEYTPVSSNLLGNPSWTIPLVDTPFAETPEGREFYDLSSKPRDLWDIS